VYRNRTECICINKCSILHIYMSSKKQSKIIDSTSQCFTVSNHLKESKIIDSTSQCFTVSNHLKHRLPLSSHRSDQYTRKEGWATEARHAVQKERRPALLGERETSNRKRGKTGLIWRGKLALTRMQKNRKGIDANLTREVSIDSNAKE
jgi:hypothetical protein